MTNHKVISSLSLCFLLFTSFSSLAQKAPDFSLPGDGKHISLSSLKGKVVYVDFWASWCDPCRKSFPWMNEMHSRYDNKKFTIVAINLDASKADAAKFLNIVPAKFDVAYDPDGKIASKYKLKTMPSSYLIDQKGNLVYAHRGYREGETHEIEQKIQQLLN
jgi:thiol-disulfide isomerase/thioredoxin